MREHIQRRSSEGLSLETVLWPKSTGNMHGRSFQLNRSFREADDRTRPAFNFDPTRLRLSCRANASSCSGIYMCVAVCVNVCVDVRLLFFLVRWDAIVPKRAGEMPFHKNKVKFN